jgi:hypothetical protein
MLFIKIFFPEDIYLQRVVDFLINCDEFFKPIYFNVTDRVRNKEDRIADKKRFDEFRQKNPNGYCLFTDYGYFNLRSIKGTNFSYSLSFYSKTSKAKMNKIAENIRKLLEKMLEFNPIFGFAGNWEEYKHRNFIYKKLMINFRGEVQDASHEGFYGFNLKKELPGLYWYTIISKEMLKQHDINLDKITKEAALIKESNNCYLINFYEKYFDWQLNIEKLDGLCRQEKRIFFIGDMKEDIKKVNSFKELDEQLKKW